MKRLNHNKKTEIFPSPFTFVCERCKDTGEFELTMNGITNVKNGNNFVTFKAFCYCKKGRDMADEFDNGRGKK